MHVCEFFFSSLVAVSVLLPNLFWILVEKPSIQPARLCSWFLRFDREKQPMHWQVATSKCQLELTTSDSFLQNVLWIWKIAKTVEDVLFLQKMIIFMVKIYPMVMSLLGWVFFYFRLSIQFHLIWFANKKHGNCRPSECAIKMCEKIILPSYNNKTHTTIMIGTILRHFTQRRIKWKSLFDTIDFP